MLHDISSTIAQTVKDYKGSAPLEAVELRTGVEAAKLAEVVANSTFLKIDKAKKTIFFIKNLPQKTHHRNSNIFISEAKVENGTLKERDFHTKFLSHSEKKQKP